MFKKIISIILTVAVVCSLVVPAVYADEPDCLTNGHSFSDPPGIMKGFDGEIQGFPVKVSIKYCSKCKFYFHECDVLGIKLEYMSLTGFTGIDGELQAFLFTQIGRIMGSNASASQFQAGGGSASPGGVGRHPAGYVGQGVPNYTSSGNLIMYVEPYALAFKSGMSPIYPYSQHSIGFGSCGDIQSLGPSGSGDEYFRKYWWGAVYKFTAPVTGIYYVGSEIGNYEFGYLDVFPTNNTSDARWRRTTFGFKLNKKYHNSISLKAGSECFFSYNYYYENSNFTPCMYKYQLYPIPICVEPLETSITNNTSITINNNTWNGNIYVDSSNKLTYIYPQYTTVNENNETVTNISNNPIIYNEETKQYYTYDSVTNNYYYITYGDPAPTPTPTPTPDPGGSTPGPDNPSPSPSPSTAPGGSSDKETGGNSFFNFIFGFGSDTGKDENGKKGIIWSLISLLVSCVTFVVGMGTAYSYLFPFLPPGLCTTIHICVLVLFLFAVIKFIRSFI